MLSAIMIQLEQWSFATMGIGKWFVMTFGTNLMPGWPAINLDFHDMVHNSVAIYVPQSIVSHNSHHHFPVHVYTYLDLEKESSLTGGWAGT